MRLLVDGLVSGNPAIGRLKRSRESDNWQLNEMWSIDGSDDFFAVGVS